MEEFVECTFTVSVLTDLEYESHLELARNMDNSFEKVALFLNLFWTAFTCEESDENSERQALLDNICEGSGLDSMIPIGICQRALEQPN